MEQLEKQRHIDELKGKVSSDLAKIAFYLFQTTGFPLDHFNDEFKKRGAALLDQISFISNFRREHPEILDNKI